MMWQWVLTVCGGIATICGAIAAIKKLLNPLIKLHKRVSEVEEHDQRDMQRFSEIDDRFVRQKKENQAMMKALYAVMGHYLDGDSVEAIKLARAALVEHIIES